MRIPWIGLGVVLISGLLAVSGVVASRSGGGSAPVSAAVSNTAIAVSDRDISGLCYKLSSSLPEKARGLPFLAGPFNAHDQQLCRWLTADPTANSTWGLTVEVVAERDEFQVGSAFDQYRKLLENPKLDNVETNLVPGVGDLAVAGPIPDSNVAALPPLPGAQSAMPTSFEDLSRPGAAALVRARDVVIKIEWVGADYPSDIPPRDRNHSNGTALPPEQAESEAVGVARDVMRILGL